MVFIDLGGGVGFGYGGKFCWTDDRFNDGVVGFGDDDDNDFVDIDNGERCFFFYVGSGGDGFC